MNASNQSHDFSRNARFVTLIDQALYTGTNFVLAMSLAAFVSIESLGHFALIASVSALLHSLYVGIILEPLTVFGSPVHESRLRAIYANVGSMIAAVALMLVLPIYAINNVTESPYVLDVALGLGLFSGQSIVLCNKRTLLVRGFIRKSLMVSLRYWLSACAIGLYVLLQGGYNEYSLVVIVFTSSVLASGKWWLTSLTNRCKVDELMRVVGVVRKYTFWTVVTSLPASASIYGIYWIAELSADRAVVGQIKLCEQLITPLAQIVMTMSVLDQIESAKEFKDANSQKISNRLKKRVSTYSTLAGVYVVILIGSVIAFDVLGSGITDGFLISLFVYCVIPFLYAYSFPRNVAAKSCRQPVIIATAYFGMSVWILSMGAWWAPSELLELVGLLVIGWFINAAILEGKVSTMLSDMRGATEVA